MPRLPGTEVVVTDNASGDGSAETITNAIEKGGWGAWARCEPLPKNGGYAYGNNAPIRTALGRPNPPAYVLLLNPDTELLAGRDHRAARLHGDHPECAIAGSRLEDERGRVHCSAFNFPTAWSELDRGLELGIVSRLLGDHVVARPIPDHACEVDWVAGASMMVRREVFERIGLIDEAYFLYFEEVDFLSAPNAPAYERITFRRAASFITWARARASPMKSRRRGASRALVRLAPALLREEPRRAARGAGGLGVFLLAAACDYVRCAAEEVSPGPAGTWFTDYLQNGVLARAPRWEPSSDRMSSDMTQRRTQRTERPNRYSSIGEERRKPNRRSSCNRRARCAN